MHTRADLIGTYLQRSLDVADFWAWEEVQRIIAGPLDEAISMALDLIQASETEEQVCYVAAGPIEDLLTLESFPAFERASRNSAKVRRALQAVRILESEDVYAQWKSLLIGYGMWRQYDT